MKITVQVDKRLLDQITEMYATKNQNYAVNSVLREFVTLNRFKKLMKRHAGTLEFEGYP